MPSRISGNAGAETNTMVDDFCNDLYAFLGEDTPSTPVNKNGKRKSKKLGILLILIYIDIDIGTKMDI